MQPKASGPFFGYSSYPEKRACRKDLRFLYDAGPAVTP